MSKCCAHAQTVSASDERLREEPTASDERLREEPTASDERLREEPIATGHAAPSPR
jgi:2-C-methyl-D-erythritol 2,4-cyclodiphosphate synthase